ncbi:MAG TPA: hypothetical protein VL485_32765 [Ktedonobacteraceae bacterium]|jgi:hypothetical protein|nr:hypothetical protein [Ktedonobacteraceae bacterium]
MTESEQEEAVWRITERYVAELKAGRQPRLQEYLARYPHYASAIADFAAYYQALELQLPEETLEYHSPTPDERALLQRALQQTRFPPEPLSSLLSARQGSTLTRLADELDIGEDIVMLLEQRMLAEESIPALLIERLAFVLQRSAQDIRAYLHRTPPARGRQGATTHRRYVAEEAASYAQDRPSQAPARNFLQVLEESQQATPKQKTFWREIVQEESP